MWKVLWVYDEEWVESRNLPSEKQEWEVKMEWMHVEMRETNLEKQERSRETWSEKKTSERFLKEEYLPAVEVNGQGLILWE